MNKLPIASIVTAVVLVLALVLYSVFYEVRFSEKVVKIRFGKPVAVIDEPGPKFKWPVPIETVKHYDVRWRVLDTAETEIKTSDGQNIIVGCFAIWRIDDPLLFHKRLPVEAEAEINLRSRINESRAKVIGQHAWSEFVNLDDTLVQENWERIEQEMLVDCKDPIKDDYGVDLKRIAIRRISLPQEATAKVLEAMKTERERLAEKYIKEGEAKREAIKARAESQAKQILAFADRKAKETTSAGIAASERIFAQIAEEDADFFIWLRWLEAIEASFGEGGKGTTFFLDTNNEVFQRFGQPPEELMAGPRENKEPGVAP